MAPNKKIRINESNIRQIVEESLKRILFESESYGWEVDESEVSAAYEYLCNEIGEQEANAAIVGSMGSDALAASLAYIFRMYNMSGWKEYKTRELNEEVENSDYDPNMPVIIVGGKLEGEYTIGEIVEKFPISGYKAGSENPDFKIKTAGYPRIEGYLGPMWDGGRIRYESPDAYDLFSI